MPQGRAELHEKFGDDGTAWALLEKAGWTERMGWMSLPDGKQWSDLSLDEKEAAEYLVTEWDWAIN